jgi:predicted transcriptional regulator
VTTDRPIFLGELESAVIDHLWSAGPAEVKDVHKAIGRPRRITLNTVQTTLKRLYEKGLLTREKVSHAFVYAPAMSREEYQRRTLDQTLGLLLRGERGAMVAAFVDLAERAGSDELERLERLVAERRAMRARGSR